MDREDVERLVRVEENVSHVVTGFAAFKDETSTNLAIINGKLDSLLGTRTAGKAVLTLLVQLVPFVALGASLVAMIGAR